MSKSVDQWLDEDVAEFRDKPVSWISQYHFFRDPIRPSYSDTSCFFSPADGIILYQEVVKPDECLVEIKGKSYCVRDALRDPHFEGDSLVIGIFMTFYDVHVNRVPYSGLLSYKLLDPITTHNHPMLEVEQNILDQLRVGPAALEYLHHNERMVNRVYAPDLRQFYYMLQIADYDVNCITPFQLKQNFPAYQGSRFSQVRYGSQVDLVVPLSSRHQFTTAQKTGHHVEAGVDPLVRISSK
ncbi:MAG: Phosphatidylserine decarboxylase [uncultured Chthoniobacterales bacterium]|uniref:Phosphatidylserine decarboxylase n=1 Tax=uncultured Chthoniobacterales bacterium TaxID=1836801 RepID=A0A6J4I3X8_9BACT|nr:MAG: Phosphatidylserine decarboxylase [uncultured Chthoniobacterales bacterium]